MAKALIKQNTNSIPTLHSTTGPVFTDKDKANALANNFEKVHKLTENMSNDRTERKIITENKKNTNAQVDPTTIQHVPPSEIKIAIKYTASKKAPGNDNIQNIVLKNLPQKAIIQLTNIFNACLRISYFPKTWKHAIILAFHKPGKDKLFLQNYRPISLLPTLSKTFEKIILNRIKIHEKDNNTLMQEQFGFREGRRTVHQLARLTNDITTEFNKNKSTALILLDIEKTFDTVWHTGLHWSADCWDCSVERPKNRTRSFRSQMVNKQGRI